MKKLTKKQWGLVLAGIILLGGGGTYAYAQNQSSVKIAEAKEQLNDSSDKLVKLTTEIQALLDTKDDHYLVKDVNDTQIKALQEKVNKETATPGGVELPKESYITFNKESKKAQDTMGKVVQAYKTQTAINSLYQNKDKKQAMNGTTIVKDLPIVDDLKKETVETIKKEWFKKDATSSYDKTVNDLITGADSQYAQIVQAKGAVAKVFQNGKIVSTDKKIYDTAKKETDKIKNEKAKKELSDQLAKVKVDIDKKEKSEAEKKTETTNAEAPAENKAAVANQESATKADDTQAAASPAPSTNDNAASGYADNGGYQPSYDDGQGNGGGYTPPTNGSNGGGSQGGSSNGGSQGGSNQGGSSNGGSQGGGNQGGSNGGGSQGGGSDIPAGWIVPPYPIGSPELGGWIYDNGYSGYDSSDGYIRPY